MMGGHGGIGGRARGAPGGGGGRGALPGMALLGRLPNQIRFPKHKQSPLSSTGKTVTKVDSTEGLDEQYPVVGPLDTADAMAATAPGSTLSPNSGPGGRGPAQENNIQPSTSLAVNAREEGWKSDPSLNGTPIGAWMTSMMAGEDEIMNLNETQPLASSSERGSAGSLPIGATATAAVTAAAVAGIMAGESTLQPTAGASGVNTSRDRDRPRDRDHPLEDENRDLERAETMTGEPSGRPLRTELVHSHSYASSIAGTHRQLECFVFLLPIRQHKNRIVSILSHWTMSTIILIPEAHAFLAVDSADGRSTSHIMLSMNQVPNEHYEPTLRITTCHGGTLRIRFPNQTCLDNWMGLFSEEDRQALAARSLSTGSSNAEVPPMTFPNNPALFDTAFGTGSGNGSGHSQFLNIENNANGLRRRSHAQPSPLDRGVGISEGSSSMSPMGAGTQDRGGSGAEPGSRLLSPLALPFVGTTATAADMAGSSNLSAGDLGQQKRQSWASRLSDSSLNRWWNRRDSRKSESGINIVPMTAQTIGQYDQSRQRAPLPEDRRGGADGITGGSEGQNRSMTENDVGLDEQARTTETTIATTTTAKNADIPPTGNGAEHNNSIHRKKNQPLFMNVSETVIEVQEGEAESLFETEKFAAAVLGNHPSPRPGHHGAMEDHGVMAVREGSSPVESLTLSIHPHGLLPGDQSLLPPTRQQDSSSRTLHSPSTDDEQGLALLPKGKGVDDPTMTGLKIVTGVEPELSNANPILEDSDSDDLYDPEFGIGGGHGEKQRRRRQRTNNCGETGLGLGPGSPYHGVIPPASVISAAAAAVSQGWSESDALSAAMEAYTNHRRGSVETTASLTPTQASGNGNDGNGGRKNLSIAPYSPRSATLRRGGEATGGGIFGRPRVGSQASFLSTVSSRLKRNKNSPMSPNAPAGPWSEPSSSPIPGVGFARDGRPSSVVTNASSTNVGGGGGGGGEGGNSDTDTGNTLRLPRQGSIGEASISGESGPGEPRSRHSSQPGYTPAKSSGLLNMTPMDPDHE
ncbi:hypothetical protein BGW38_003863 [Lunasporangiospora selenospora]|uniref:Uncharacterized protein n=1 Tax=Lunasporangiospora selenospora TaxID=979761 RepID=A0A9P6FS64_9FUNG|nr:hypothetical protein BGW38_003863 [Lunasporangiospora selenospora]